MSNHPTFLDATTLTSQVLFLFSIFVDNLEMINPWNFDPSTPHGSKVIEIWKFDWNGCSRINLPFWIYVLCKNYCSSHPFILKFGVGKFLRVGDLKITLKRLKNKLVLSHLRFQDQYLWPDWCQIIHEAKLIIEKKCFFFFFYRYRPIIKPKMAFSFLLGSSK